MSGIIVPAGMGFGDVLMHGPALQALRPDRVVVESRYLELARRFELGGGGADVVAGPCPHWTDHFSAEQRHRLVEDALTPRTELLARFLGVDWPRVFRRARGSMLGDHVAIFPFAYEDRRSITCGEELQHHLSGLGMNPHLLGRDGFANLDALVDHVAAARAVVAVDSGPMHVAAVLGVPLVACFTHVAPSARLSWMGDGPQAAVVPFSWPGHRPPGERHPRAWGADIAAKDIADALVRLLEYAP